MTSFLSSAASIIPGPAAKTCASWTISITITLTSMASLGDPLIKDGKPDLASPNFKRIFRAATEPAIAGGLGIEKGYAADAWKTADLISNVGSTAAILYMRDYVTNRQHA